MSATPAVLYRCRTPPYWLCPCGRVARELRRHDVAVEEVRVPWRRRERAEVAELTGQTAVPVLLSGEEAICDSRRIVENLRWRAGEAGEAGEAGA